MIIVTFTSTINNDWKKVFFKLLLDFIDCVNYLCEWALLIWMGDHWSDIFDILTVQCHAITGSKRAWKQLKKLTSIREMTSSNKAKFWNSISDEYQWNINYTESFRQTADFFQDIHAVL